MNLNTSQYDVRRLMPPASVFLCALAALSATRCDTRHLHSLRLRCRHRLPTSCVIERNCSKKICRRVHRRLAHVLSLRLLVRPCLCMIADVIAGLLHLMIPGCLVIYLLHLPGGYVRALSCETFAVSTISEESSATSPNFFLSKVPCSPPSCKAASASSRNFSY